MASDNVNIKDSSGNVVPIATDEVGGVEYQEVKLVSGTKGETAAIGGDATNGLDVDVTRVQGTVTVSGTVTASGPLTDTQLRASDVKVTLDNEYITLNPANPLLLYGQSVNGQYLSAYAEGHLVQGSDATRRWNLNVDSDGHLQVDLNAGTNAIGKLAANSGVDIGDVDVTSLPTVELKAGSAVIGGVKIVDAEGSITADIVDTGEGGPYGLTVSTNSGNPPYVQLASNANAIIVNAKDIGGNNISVSEGASPNGYGLAILGKYDGGEGDLHSYIRTDSSGHLQVDLNAGTNNIGDVDVASIAAGTAYIGQTGLNAYRSSDSSYQPARLDKATNTLQVIEYEHHEIHAGSHFEIQDVVDLAINNVRDIQITTPNSTTWAHLIFEITTEAETDIYLYENVAIGTAGSAVTPVNNDRNSSTASTLTVKTIDNTSTVNANSDTDPSGATLIYHHIAGAGKSIGNIGRDREIILDQNQDYSLRFIATAAGYVNYTLEWYEHVNIA